MDAEPPCQADEPRAQLKLCLWWLGGSLLAIFAGSSISSLFGLFGLLLSLAVAVLVIVATALLLKRVFAAGFSPRKMALISAAGLVFAFAVPQAWYCDSYAHALFWLMIDVGGIREKVSAQMGKPQSAENGIIYEEYFPGFLAGSQSTGVVYDPLDRPEPRVGDLFDHPGYVHCSHLISHYYNCTA